MIKSIEKTAEENSEDPFLIAMAERAKAVQENYEDRQTSTQETLQDLLEEIEQNEQRKKEQAEKGLDGLTYFVYLKLTEEKIANADSVSRRIGQAFSEFPEWRRSEKDLLELRQRVTFALYAEEEDLDKVAYLAENLFQVLAKTEAPR